MFLGQVLPKDVYGNILTDVEDNSSATFFYNYTIADDFTGDVSIRTRVTCSESLIGGWDNQGKMDDSAFSAIGTLNQGEVEDWSLFMTPRNKMVRSKSIT